MIRAQGKLAQNLGGSLRTCFPRRARAVFIAHFLSVEQTGVTASQTYCGVTPSPANEIMNSRLDTKADEGIFEHSKGRARGERGREHSQN